MSDKEVVLDGVTVTFDPIGGVYFSLEGGEEFEVSPDDFRRISRAQDLAMWGNHE